MRRLGLTPSTEVLDVERGVPPAATVEALGLRPGEQAIRVRRLRLADGAPMSVDDAWYSAALAPDLDTAPLTGSVYELLRERYDVTIDHAEQTVAATEAGDEYGALLGLDPPGRCCCSTGCRSQATGASSTAARATAATATRSSWRSTGG
jgi:GntR family transcriptional regulator